MIGNIHGRSAQRSAQMMCYTFRQGFIEVAGGQLSSVAVPVKARPRLEKREVIEGQMEVLEVVNSYLAIPVTTFSGWNRLKIF